MAVTFRILVLDLCFFVEFWPSVGCVGFDCCCDMSFAAVHFGNFGLDIRFCLAVFFELLRFNLGNLLLFVFRSVSIGACMFRSCFGK